MYELGQELVLNELFADVLVALRKSSNLLKLKGVYDCLQLERLQIFKDYVQKHVKFWIMLHDLNFCWSQVSIVKFLQQNLGQFHDSCSKFCEMTY